MDLRVIYLAFINKKRLEKGRKYYLTVMELSFNKWLFKFVTLGLLLSIGLFSIFAIVFMMITGVSINEKLSDMHSAVMAIMNMVSILIGYPLAYWYIDDI